MKFIKFVSLFIALLIPVTLGFGIVKFSCDMLEKTSFYEEPLKIAHIWATRNARKIRGADSDNENVIKFSITISGITLNIIAETNRPPENKEEEKQIMGAIFWNASKGIHKKEMIREMLKPAGHERLINIKTGGLTAAGKTRKMASIFIIGLFCALLYLPIIILAKRFIF